MSTIFGGNTGLTYEQLQQRRKLAETLREQNQRTPRNAGEGIHALARALVARGVDRQNKKENERLKNEYGSLWDGMWSQSDGGSGDAPFVPPMSSKLPDPSTAEGIAADTMGALGRGPLRPEQVKAGLVKRGLPEHIAEGFVMNFKDESGLDPGINERNPIVPGSRGGFGLAQWTGPRRKALEAFAQSQGRPASDPELQMDFLMQELQGPESRAAQSIFAAQDAGSAAAAIVNDFLRPAEEHRTRRAQRYTGGGVQMAQNGPMDIQALTQILSAPDEYVPPGQKAIAKLLLQQQLQAGDPMYRLELERAQLQNEALRNPPPPDPTALQRNYQAAVQQGYPGTIMDYQRDVAAASRPQNNVSVVNQGADKFAEAFASGDAKTLAEVGDAGLAAQRNLGRIEQLESLLNQAPSGAGAALKSVAGEWGINTEGLSEIQAAQALINSMVPEQRPPGSGPMSDADLALFKQSLPRIINQPGGNAMILDTMRGIAQYDAEGAEIVQDLRAGRIDRATAFERLQSRENPLANFKQMTSPSENSGDAEGNSAADSLEQQIESIPDFGSMSTEELRKWIEENG